MAKVPQPKIPINKPNPQKSPNTLMKDRRDLPK